MQINFDAYFSYIFDKKDTNENNYLIFIEQPIQEVGVANNSQRE